MLRRESIPSVSYDADVQNFRSICAIFAKVRRGYLQSFLAEWMRLHDCCMRGRYTDLQLCYDILTVWNCIALREKESRKREFFATQKYFHAYWKIIFAVLWENLRWGKEMREVFVVRVSELSLKKLVWFKWTREVRPILEEERRILKAQLITRTYLMRWRRYCSREDRLYRSFYELRALQRSEGLSEFFWNWRSRWDKAAFLRSRGERLTSMRETGLLLACISQWIQAAVLRGDALDREKLCTKRSHFKRFKNWCRNELFLKRIFTRSIFLKYLIKWISVIRVEKTGDSIRTRVWYKVCDNAFRAIRRSFLNEISLKSFSARAYLRSITIMMIRWRHCSETEARLRFFFEKISGKLSVSWVFQVWKSIWVQCKKSRAVYAMAHIIDLSERYHSFTTGNKFFEMRITILVRLWKKEAILRSDSSRKVCEIYKKVELIKRNLTLLSSN